MADYLLILIQTKPEVMKTTLKISLFAIMFAGFFTSCKTTENLATEETSPKDEIVSEAPVELVAELEEVEQVADTLEREFFASISRSACFGACPTYNMIIYSDGFVELEGIRSIELIGKFTTNLSVAQVQNFRVRANRTGFMDMEDKYDGAVSDLPSATTTIVLNGVKKSVYRRFDYPQSILKFEELFDELLKIQKWSPVKPIDE